MQSLLPMSRRCENIAHDVGSIAGLRCWLNIVPTSVNRSSSLSTRSIGYRSSGVKCDKRHKLVRASRPVQIRSLPGAVPD